MNHTETVAVALLDFDYLNPRITDTPSSQAEAVKGILANEARSCIELLKHIVGHGLSPADLMMTIKSRNERYVVVEGNRRLLALKLLSGDPIALAQLSSRQRKQVDKISQGASAPSEVNVLVFDSRAEAQTWISLKHSKSSDGAAAHPWKPFEKDRYEYTINPQHCAPALALFHLALRLGETNPHLAANVRRIHDSHYSTLQRIVKSTHFRRLTGITFNGTFISDSNGQEHLESIVTDLFQIIGNPNANSRALNKEPEVEAFLVDLSKRHKATSTGEPVTLDIDIPRQADTPPTSPGGRPVQQDIPVITEAAKASVSEPAKRPPLTKALGGLQLTSLGEPELSLLREVQRVQIQRSPNLIAAAYRILVDLATKRFEKEVTEFNFDGRPDLDERVSAIIDYLEPSASSPIGVVQGWTTLKSYRQQLASKPLKPLQLGVHGNNTTVLPSTIEKLDPIIRVILVAIDEELGKADRL